MRACVQNNAAEEQAEEFIQFRIFRVRIELEYYVIYKIVHFTKYVVWFVKFDSFVKTVKLLFVHKFNTFILLYILQTLNYFCLYCKMKILTWVIYNQLLSSS